MFKYNFQINKEACFTYWVQSLIEWGWYFNPKTYEYNIHKFGEFTADEARSLECLKKILQEKDHGFLWLWDRYNDKNIDDHDELKKWNDIKNALSGRFERIWSEEFPKLEKWREELVAFQFTKINKLLNKSAIFFGIGAESRDIKVQLLINYDTGFPGGHVKKEFNNLILLNISEVDNDRINLVVEALAHETIHLFEYEYRATRQLGGLGDLMSQSYKKIIKPRGLAQKEPSWRHLSVESIVTSIVGVVTEHDYWRHMNADDALLLEQHKFSEHVYRGHEEDYNYQIKTVAARILKKTAAYLDDDKKIDEEYCDFVSQSWLDFRMGR